MIKIVSNAARALKPLARKVSYHSPTILTVGGVGLIIGGTAWMCKSTLKAAGSMEWYEERKCSKEAEREMCETDAERAQVSKDIRRMGRAAAMDVAKAYAPAVGMEVLGIFCMLSANHILRKRVIAYAAVAAASEAKLRKYRDMVKEELGEAKDDHFLVQDEEVEVTETKILKNGKEKVVSRKARIIQEAGLSQYHVTFDEQNSREWLGSYSYDQSYIMEIENWANAELQHEGVLYLNDVLRKLGIIDLKNGKRYRPDEGQVVGWLKDGDGDGFVWIRMVEFDENYEPIPSGDRDVNQKYRGFWLDFNVDGAILGKA